MIHGSILNKMSKIIYPHSHHPDGEFCSFAVFFIFSFLYLIISTVLVFILWYNNQKNKIFYSISYQKIEKDLSLQLI